MVATLRISKKLRIQNRFVVEYSLHEVPKSHRYPHGVKYGLICKDLQTGALVLFDNHDPKGPHIHLNKKEVKYNFVSEEKLIKDFQSCVLERMGIHL